MDPAEWDADDENLDGDSEIKEASTGRDGLIFLIDSSKSMFACDEVEKLDSPFKISLKCCLTAMKNKIISSERDMIGIILYGTSKTKNDLNVSHLSILQELLQPSAAIIKQLENMLQDDFGDFIREYGHSDDFSLSDALWLCQTAFSKSQFKLNSQRILLFTNNDHPHRGSANKQHQARTKAKDLGQMDIDIDLLHIGRDFNPDNFFKDLIQIAKGDDSDDWQLPDPSNKFDELLKRVCCKDHKKRSYGRVHFTLGEGVKFGVCIYNLVRRTAWPRKVKLDKTTNEEVKSSTKKFDATTGDMVLAAEQLKYQEYGDKKIILKPEEIRQLRKITEPGLKLLGFKPADKIKMHYHVKPSSFIYPEEGLIEGSRKLFTALLDRCISRKVVPICSFAPRIDSFPSLVALLPQEEVLGASNEQELAPGFHLVFLPYSDDIRKLNIESSVKAEPEHVEKAKQVIQKLRFKYDPYQFDSPKLQTHWRNIEALALEHNDLRTVEDTTVPDYDYMKNALGSLAQEFLDEVYPEGYVPMEKSKATGGRKRQLNQKQEKQTVKSKKEKVDEDDGNMKELAEQGKVETLTVNDLKAYLFSQGCKVTRMRKGELVTKVYEHLGIPQP